MELKLTQKIQKIQKILDEVKEREFSGIPMTAPMLLLNYWLIDY